MQIVIDIPEETYHDIKVGNTRLCSTRNVALYAIANGVPIPKGHGRLIDVDEIPIDCDYYDVDAAPTIIEASNESEVDE